MPKPLVVKHEITQSLLTLLYVEKGWTLNQIAAHLGCATQTVLNYMSKYGIARRIRYAHFIGKVSHRKGKRGVYSEETLEKFRMASVDRGARPPVQSGERHWNWRGGISTENDLLRHSQRAKKWRIEIFRRDCFTCQQCGYKGKKLNAHHLKAWSKYPELRFELSNGLTVCQPCHRMVHNKQKGVFQ